VVPREEPPCPARSRRARPVVSGDYGAVDDLRRCAGGRCKNGAHGGPEDTDLVHRRHRWQPGRGNRPVRPGRHQLRDRPQHRARSGTARRTLLPMSTRPGQNPARAARPGPAASTARAARTPPRSGARPGARASTSKTAAGYPPDSSSSSRPRPRSKTTFPPPARQPLAVHLPIRHTHRTD